MIDSEPRVRGGPPDQADRGRRRRSGLEGREPTRTKSRAASGGSSACVGVRDRSS